MKSARHIESDLSLSKEIGWRQFPQFEAILSNEQATALLAKVEKTCRQLNDILQSGSEADKARAQMAMTAYGRSLDLLRLLSEMREQEMRQK